MTHQPGFAVRRAKALFSSRCETCPALVAPAGSNRSNRGGNEAVEAFVVEGSEREPGEHAGRNLSERRAGLEKADAEADPPTIRGRPLL